MRRSQVYTNIDRWTGWLLPPRCVLCRRPGQPPAYDLCADCESEIPVVPDPGRRCGLPRNGGEEGEEGEEGQEGQEGQEGEEGEEG